MVSCRKTEDGIAPEKVAGYDIEIVGIDDGSTKLLPASTLLGTADLGDKHSTQLLATLMEVDLAGNRTPVSTSSATIKFQWGTSDLKTSFKEPETDAITEAILTASTTQAGDNKFLVSATYNGTTVVRGREYPVTVEDDKEIKWDENFPTTISGKDTFCVLRCNYTGHVRVSSNNDNVCIGTASDPTEKYIDIDIDSSNPEIPIHFKYTGTTSSTVTVAAVDRDDSKYGDQADANVKVIDRIPVSMTATYKKNNSSHEYLYEKTEWGTDYATYEVIVTYDNGDEVNVSNSPNLTVSSIGVDCYKGEHYCLIYPSIKVWGGTYGSVSVTYTENYDGGTFTKTCTQNNIKFGPVIDKLRIDVAGGVYSKTITYKSGGSNRQWSWQTYDGYVSGSIPYVNLNIPSQYDGAAFTVTAINADKDERVIYTGNVRFQGGTGVGTSTTEYYWFKDYYDYNQGYCYFGTKPTIVGL